MPTHLAHDVFRDENPTRGRRSGWLNVWWLLPVMLLPLRSHGAFHFWTINEIYSSADGSVQFIEFINSFDNEQFISGHNIISRELISPNRTNTFLIPSNLGSSSTAGKTFLVATPGFASLPGGVTPDYTIPTGFLFRIAGRVNMDGAGGADETYTNLPTDGVKSIDSAGIHVINSPKNFAGTTGSVNVPPPAPPTPAFSVGLSDAGLEPLLVTLFVGDDLIWTNQGATAHSSTSGQSPVPDGLWSSDSIGPGETFQRTFNTVGSFPYFSTNDVGNTMFEGVVNVVSTNDRRMTQIIDNNGEMELSWISPNGRKFDLLFMDDLLDPAGLKLALPNLRPSGTGTNVLTKPPYLASPIFAENDHLTYAVNYLPDTVTPIRINLSVVVSNLVAPVTMTHAGDGTDRLFILEQTGKILVLDSNRTLLPDPFLDISANMTNLANPAPGGFFGTNLGVNTVFDERGLLGLAFHPDYESNGRFFIYYSSPKSGSNINHESIVAEYQVSATNANMADPAETIILRQDEPEFNHNAGSLVFGPDGYLYIAFGDGGGGGDGLGDPFSPHGPTGNAQNTSNWLGSILRIDVDGGSPYAVPADNPFVGQPGADEIFAYGLRNPFKMSFDRAGTNALFVADVGQNEWEEINILHKGGNYGWRILEGNHAHDAPTADVLGVDVKSLKYPIHAYDHTIGISIIGGYVYRGTNFSDLAGKYVFGDFSTGFFTPDGHLFYLEESRPGIWDRVEFNLAPSNAPLGRFVKGFGEDEAGNLYLLSTLILGPTGTSGDIRLLEQP